MGMFHDGRRQGEVPVALRACVAQRQVWSMWDQEEKLNLPALAVVGAGPVARELWFTTGIDGSLEPSHLWSRR